MLQVTRFFDLDKTIASGIFEGVDYPWQVLPKIGEFIKALGPTLPKEEYEQAGEYIWISKTASIMPSAHISGPCIIDHNAEVRHCAFIRGNAIIGKNSVVGNSTEIKNAILFDGVQVPHYNYVGDSILGYKSHMGAGAITSNVKSDKSLVKINIDGQVIETGLKKFGAIIGDNVEIGCGTVLNPGSVVGKNTNIYPLSLVRGFVKENCIYKNKVTTVCEIVEKQP
ncbi:MAG TPA: UDP-N-acetylglucosamine pyrophosphorylase [Clostridiales bacterium]|nr:UDP-N-acetylglucosamine pyrophosphorylase [Clostridiales bacterium]